MPPLAISPTTREEKDNEEITATIDLILITLALLTSIVLSLIPRAKSLSHTRKPIFSLFIVTTAVIATVTALALSAVALVLGWTREISLDALSGVVFALATALIQIPIETLKYGLHVYYMSRRKSLDVKPQNFRYVRFGKPCNHKGNEWRDDYDGSCRRNECRVDMFIRCLPVKTSHPLFELCVGKPKNEFFDIEQPPSSSQRDVSSVQSQDPTSVPLRHANSDSQPPNDVSGEDPSQISPDNAVLNINYDQQWHGLRVGHTRNYVKLRDTEEGITSWWWESVAKATDLVDNPSNYDVKDTSTMLNALALLSDIIAIGDLVFRYRWCFLEHQWTANPGVVSSKTATPGIMCCKLMKHLGLESWAGNHQDMESVQFPDTGVRRPTKKVHGILFAILAEKSRMFADKRLERSDSEDEHATLLRCSATRRDRLASWLPCFRSVTKKERKSAQDILDDLMRDGNIPPEAFKDKCKKEVDDWLKEWGCSADSLLIEEHNEAILRSKSREQERMTSVAGTNGPG